MTRKIWLLILLCLFAVGGCSNFDTDDDFRKPEDLNNPKYKVGAMVGAASEPYVGKALPNAVEKQYPAMTDMVAALESKQIDALVFTRATLESIAAEKPDQFQILDEPLGETEIHMVISPKTQLKNLTAEVNEFLEEKSKDGTLQKSYRYWFVENKTEMPQIETKTGDAPTKKLVVGTQGTLMPVSFYVGDRLVGFDVEIIEMFAAQYGYELEYRVADFMALLTAAEFGEIDLICGSIMYTPERAERVIFPSTPLYKMPISVMTRKLRILDEPLTYTDMHLVISPSTQVPNLAEQVDEFLIRMKADGTIDRMRQYWTVEKNVDMPSIPKPESPSQVLRVGTNGTIPQHSFYVGNELSGFDIELIKRFAHEYNYELEFRVEPMESLLDDVEFGKADMLCDIIGYTEELAERVRFSKTPVFRVPAGMTVRNEQSGVENLFAYLKTSFEKTLIREERYKMILDGLKVTLLIALGSLVLGTLFGFIICMMKRSPIKSAAKLTEAFIALISGLPIVLTLMICFYIIFSGMGLSEITVSIIAFSIDFGCYVAIILNSGIESVSAGEIEAATAMGMSNWQIFKTITFPQAVQKTFSVYRRQVISLIKATSVVGYIAVQDLTKVSDIIRARTYDAFFSLIFTAAIYFLIARICIYLLDTADSRMNRRKRNATG